MFKMSFFFLAHPVYKAYSKMFIKHTISQDNNCNYITLQNIVSQLQNLIIYKSYLTVLRKFLKSS